MLVMDASAVTEWLLGRPAADAVAQQLRARLCVMLKQVSCLSN